MERALGELEFFAVSDFFHTPATLQADIVLPAATSLERTALIAYPGCAYQGEVKYRHQALPPRGEAKPDGQIFLEIGVKLGMADQFWHGNLAASWEEMGEGLPPDIRKEAWENPVGVTVYSPVIEELVEMGFLDADRQWRINGFRTATGQIEFDAVTFRAAVTDIMKPGVVHCFHGWNETNINELTDDTQPDPISGFPPFKSLLCEVSRL